MWHWNSAGNVCVCHPQAPPAFRMPEWDFWTQWEPSCPCHQHPEQRTGWKADGEEANGNGYTVASPRGWLALHPLGLWSSLELVLSLTLKLQASAVPKSYLCVLSTKPTCETAPLPILCDTKALPGLQVAVTFKSMMQKPQSLPLIFCQAAGFLSARQVPWTHMSRGALARHSWNTLIFKNQFCSSSFTHVYKVYRVGQASLEVEFHCQASKLIPFAEWLRRSVGGFTCKACHVARCLPQVTQAIRFHRPSDCSFSPPLPSLPAPHCPLLLFASPFPRHTISKTKKKSPHTPLNNILLAEEFYGPLTSVITPFSKAFKAMLRIYTRCHTYFFSVKLFVCARSSASAWRSENTLKEAVGSSLPWAQALNASLQVPLPPRAVHQDIFQHTEHCLGMRLIMCGSATQLRDEL